MGAKAKTTPKRLDEILQEAAGPTIIHKSSVHLEQSYIKCIIYPLIQFFGKQAERTGVHVSQFTGGESVGYPEQSFRWIVDEWSRSDRFEASRTMR